jgi:hypothetical protein
MANLKRSIFAGLTVLLIGAGLAVLIMSSGLAGCNKETVKSSNLDSFQVTTEELRLTELGSAPADGVSLDTVQLQVTDTLTKYNNTATFSVSSAVFANGSTSMTVPLVAGAPISVYLVSRTVGTATVKVEVGSTSTSADASFDTAYATTLTVTADSAVLDSVIGKSTPVMVKLLRPGQGLPSPGQLVSFSCSDANEIFSSQQVLSDTSGMAVTTFSLTDLNFTGNYLTITARAPSVQRQDSITNSTRIFIHLE